MQVQKKFLQISKKMSQKELLQMQKLKVSETMQQKMPNTFGIALALR